jgi:hypothetical protein
MKALKVPIHAARNQQWQKHRWVLSLKQLCMFLM